LRKTEPFANGAISPSDFMTSVADAFKLAVPPGATQRQKRDLISNYIKQKIVQV